MGRNKLHLQYPLPRKQLDDEESGCGLHTPGQCQQVYYAGSQKWGCGILDPVPNEVPKEGTGQQDKNCPWIDIMKARSNPDRRANHAEPHSPANDHGTDNHL
jgi:hypothetical protein